MIDIQYPNFTSDYPESLANELNYFDFLMILDMVNYANGQIVISIGDRMFFENKGVWSERRVTNSRSGQIITFKKFDNERFENLIQN